MADTLFDIPTSTAPEPSCARCLHARPHVLGVCSYPGCEPCGEHPPYQAHSTTSRQAAEEAKPSAGTQRARVLEVLKVAGPLTDEAIQNRLALNPSTERPRRIELVEAGLVYDTGKRGTTASGRSAVLWAAR